MTAGTIRLFLGILTVTFVLWAQQDPAIGTWKLNVAKSKYSLGRAAKSGTTKIEPFGKNGIKLTADAIYVQGNPLHIEWSAELDGKDYPVKANPNADTVSLKRIDAYTLEIRNKKAGKVMYSVQWKISKDGTSRTVTTTGTNAEGQRVESVEWYDKQ